MFRSNVLNAAFVAVFLIALAMPASAEGQTRVRRLVPILSVESIEVVVPFWTALGWEAKDPMEVDGKLIFLAFAKDGVTIHYQTLAHIEGQLPGATEMLAGSTAMIYITVTSLDRVVEALGPGAEVVIARRRTAWGADEIYVKEPGGHLVGFAQFGRN